MFVRKSEKHVPFCISSDLIAIHCKEIYFIKIQWEAFLNTTNHINSYKDILKQFEFQLNNVTGTYRTMVRVVTVDSRKQFYIDVISEYFKITFST